MLFPSLQLIILESPYLFNNPSISFRRRGRQDGTPLHYAAMGGHESVCTLLLDRGASLEARNEDVL